MNRRTIVITALPLAILVAFGLIGVVASRPETVRADPGGLPFAIDKPVQAKWQPGAAAATSGAAGGGVNTVFTFAIEAPKTDRVKSYELAREGIRLDDTQDIVIGKSHCDAPNFGLLVNNSAKAQRIVIDGLTATGCTEYGGYIDGASDWWIRNSLLQQAKGASQHGLRVASGQRIRITDSVIDARLGDKTTLWVLMGDQIELRNVKLIGGRNWFSINPDNPDLPDGHVTNVVIADCWIDLKEGQGWANPIEFMPGVDNVTITNLHVRSGGGRPPLGAWASVSGVPAAKNIRWKDIWIPAPGQAKDKPFDDVEWVKLRDDDWERILSHKGRTLDEVKADGIGPMRD